MPIVEYEQGRSFPGVIGRTAEVSSPAWPAPVRAAEGAPNILYIVLDDMGFWSSMFWGPDRDAEPDRIAADGLRYNNMHTTALCSPSRSCIVTGRNHHANGMACITELASGYPGYNGIVPFENGFLSEMLLEHGYSTFMVGKWHLTPSNQRPPPGRTIAGRSGVASSASTASSAATRASGIRSSSYDNHQVEPPKKPEEGYHLSEDLVDKAVSFIANTKPADPQKPFYLHLCFGATHAPHHVAKEWADKYKGVFDDGWDAYREKTFARQKELGIVPADAELSRHDPDVPDWDALRLRRRQLFARMMEVYAGFLEHTDHQIGRLHRVPGEAGRARQHADHGHLRQRRVRRGRADRNDERGAVLQQRAGADRGEPEADRRARRAQALQPLSLGLDLGGQHPVPALEA